MYDREYAGKAYTLEPSGGLLNAALIMQDRETDSYWSIMSGNIIAGKLTGTKMIEMPVSEKLRWKDWLKKHPQTEVLSVRGREDADVDHYEDYYTSPKGYRNIEAKDDRLSTKQPIYAMKHGGMTYAFPYFRLEGGRAFKLEKGGTVFLYRPKGANIVHSTLAFVTDSGRFIQRSGKWIHEPSGCELDLENGTFGAKSSACPSPVKGFDTFWYTWSLTNPDTKVVVE